MSRKPISYEAKIKSRQLGEFDNDLQANNKTFGQPHRTSNTEQSTCERQSFDRSGQERNTVLEARKEPMETTEKRLLNTERPIHSTGGVTMDEKKFPTLEETLYKLNGTLLRDGDLGRAVWKIANQLEDLNKRLAAMPYTIKNIMKGTHPTDDEIIEEKIVEEPEDQDVTEDE